MTQDPEEIADMALARLEAHFKTTASGLLTRRKLLRAGGGAAAALAATPASATISALMCPPRAGSFGGEASKSIAPAGSGAISNEDYSGKVPDDGPGVRHLKMSNYRTGETYDRNFVEDGAFVPEAIQEFTHFARDWRQNEEKAHDPGSVEIVWKIWRRLGMSGPFNLNSGYRSPKTNAAVGGARASYHLRAKATDLSTSERSVDQIHAAATTDQAGGVGKYSAQHFVHVDSGPVRNWGS